MPAQQMLPDSIAPCTFPPKSGERSGPCSGQFASPPPPSPTPGFWAASVAGQSRPQIQTRVYREAQQSCTAHFTKSPLLEQPPSLSKAVEGTLPKRNKTRPAKRWLVKVNGKSGQPNTSLSKELAGLSSCSPP